MDDIEKLKLVLRETDVPFFSDVELYAYYEINNRDFNTTAYRCALLKAQNSQISIGGLSIEDDSRYFRRLAAQYRPNHSRVLKGGF